MDIKLEHASTIIKKTGSGARAVREIFDFFSVTLLMGHPVFLGLQKGIVCSSSF
jgi:hypothetical protein